MRDIQDRIREMQDVALGLLSLDYVPLRLEPESKVPKWTGWQRAVTTEETILRDFARLSNLGVRTGDLHRDGTRLCAIDIDLEHGELIRSVEQALGIKVPCKQGKKGYTYFVRVDYEQKTTKIQWVRDGQKVPAIDILCIGAQTVVPPSIHPDTKLPYRWVSGTPLEQTPYETIPVFGPSLIDEIRGFCTNPDDPIFPLSDMQWAGVGGGGDTHDTCLAAVASMVARKWTDAEIHERIERAKSEACEAAGLPYNWPESQKIIQGWIDSARDKKFGEKKASRQKSQGSYVDEFVRQYGHLFRYDLDTDNWFRFDGVRWRPKQQLAVKFQITNMLPEEYRNSGFVGGIEQLLRCWPQLQVHRTQWNPSTHLLNTPEATIDLRTGTSRPHNPADMITCVTAVSPIDAAHPLWSEKKLEWFGEADVEQVYIQTLAGLCITGETRDAIIPFWVGPGGDGKTVITSVFQHILGDYVRTSTESAFIETRYGQHSEELAWLSDGTRLVIVPEAGGVWAEPRLKQVSGGDRVSAAFKHKSVFEFQPQFTLLITSNEPPRLKTGGKAMARRFHVYQFSRAITAPDPLLTDKLKAEAAAILSWMIDGAARYYQSGLDPSPVVLASSAEYIHDSDHVQQWMEECAVVGEGRKWPGQLAYENYRQWADRAGIKYQLDRPGLTRRLKSKGIISKNASIPGLVNSGKCYIGMEAQPEGETWNGGPRY